MMWHERPENAGKVGRLKKMCRNTKNDDIVRLLILYYSRVDGSPDGMEKRARIHRAVANFKAVPGFDAEALIRFFKMR